MPGQLVGQGSMADKTLYDLLEVSSGASPEIIQAAYDRLLIKFNPDRPENATNPGARIQHDAIKEAFLTIGNPAKRAQYDKKLEAGLPKMYNVQVVESFWTLPKLIVLAFVVVVGGGYYYKHQKETARLEAEKVIAAQKAREAEEKAKAEAEQARLDLQRQREAQSAEMRQRREHEAAVRSYSSEQRIQGRQNDFSAQRERQEQQRAQSQRQREESQAMLAAQRRAAQERAELCRLERERYGRAISC